MTFPLLAVALVVIATVSYLAARVTQRWALAAVGGGALMLFLHAWGYFQYTSDDAYISYRYARNLADGLGLVWNDGERVEGYSNFLWVLVLSGISTFGVDIVPAGRWLGFAFAVGAMGMAFVVTRDLVAAAEVHEPDWPMRSSQGERGAAQVAGSAMDAGARHAGPLRAGDEETLRAGQVAGFVAVMLLAASGPFALWSTAGLEAPLLAALVLAGAMLHLHERHRGGVPWSAAVWALAAMTRPDAPLFFAVSAAFKLGDAIMAMRAAPEDERDAVRRRELGAFAGYVGLFAVIYLPYFAWRYATYGYLFANTYYVKVGSGIDQYERGLFHLEIFSREHAAWLLLLAPLAMAAGVVRRLPSAYLLALAIVYGAYIIYVGGDSLVRFRLFVPLLPPFYALVAASAVGMLRALPTVRAPRWALEAAGAAAVLALMLFTLTSSIDERVMVEGDAVDERVAMGRWLKDTLPEETTIAVIPAGAIPYESRLTTIDMLGINDEHIAHRHLPLGGLGAGHEKYDSEYVLDRQPDIIILTDALDDEPRGRDRYGELVGGLILARIDMLNTPRLWEEYEARSVELEDGWFNLLVRRNAAAALAATGPP